jgi:hypothetical protein
VATPVNKKVGLNWVCIYLDFSKTAISLYLKDLIFTGKLEMVIGSIFRANNPVSEYPKNFYCPKGGS